MSEAKREIEDEQCGTRRERAIIKKTGNGFSLVFTEECDLTYEQFNVLQQLAYADGCSLSEWMASDMRAESGWLVGSIIEQSNPSAAKAHVLRDLADLIEIEGDTNGFGLMDDGELHDSDQLLLRELYSLLDDYAQNLRGAEARAVVYLEMMMLRDDGASMSVASLFANMAITELISDMARDIRQRADAGETWWLQHAEEFISKLIGVGS